jgi:hypothetical protein
MVTSSNVVPIPLVGVIAEFLKSPNEMMKRCYKDYGQVFTIPVSFISVDCASFSDSGGDDATNDNYFFRRRPRWLFVEMLHD